MHPYQWVAIFFSGSLKNLNSLNMIQLNQLPSTDFYFTHKTFKPYHKAAAKTVYPET